MHRQHPKGRKTGTSLPSIKPETAKNNVSIYAASPGKNRDFTKQFRFRFEDHGLSKATHKSRMSKLSKIEKQNKFKLIGDKMMKVQTKKLSKAEVRKNKRRLKMLRHRRLLILLLRIQTRAATEIQIRVRERLEWKQKQRRDEAATRIQRFRRALVLRRVFRDQVMQAGSFLQHIKNACAKVMQRTFRVYIWHATRQAAAFTLQRAWGSYNARMQTKQRYVDMVFNERQAAISRIQRCLRQKWRQAQARHDLHSRIVEAKAEHARTVEREARNRKKERVLSRIRRNEISRITYARKQHMLEFRARQEMAGWMHCRGLGLDLQPDDVDSITYYDDIGEAVEPTGIDDWVEYFVQNDHCTREKAKIRGMEVLLRSMSSKKKMARYKMRDVNRFFRAFDKNHDGDISTAEFKKCLIQLDMDLTPAQLDKCIHYLDNNGSGKISYTEFQAALAIYQRKYYPRKHKRITGGMSRQDMKTLRNFTMRKKGLLPPKASGPRSASTVFFP